MLLHSKSSLGTYVLKTFFPPEFTRQALSETTTHREAYTIMQTNTGETNLRWQTAHHRKCKHCTQGTVSFKAA